MAAVVAVSAIMRIPTCCCPPEPRAPGGRPESTCFETALCSQRGGTSSSRLRFRVVPALVVESCGVSSVMCGVACTRLPLKLDKLSQALSLTPRRLVLTPHSSHSLSSVASFLHRQRFRNTIDSQKSDVTLSADVADRWHCPRHFRFATSWLHVELSSCLSLRLGTWIST